MKIEHLYDPRCSSRFIRLIIGDAELIRTGTPEELMKLLPIEVTKADGSNRVSEVLFRLAHLAQAIEEANNKPQG